MRSGTKGSFPKGKFLRRVTAEVQKTIDLNLKKSSDGIKFPGIKERLSNWPFERGNSINATDRINQRFLVFGPNPNQSGTKELLLRCSRLWRVTAEVQQQIGSGFGLRIISGYRAWRSFPQGKFETGNRRNAKRYLKNGTCSSERLQTFGFDLGNWE